YTDVTFTIENTGTVNLTLTTPLSLGGADADQFSIRQQPSSPVLPSGNTTFIIRFTPTSAGSKTASLSITNNDADENPYNLNLTGTVPGPGEGEIKIQAGNEGWANPLRGEEVNI
ncbi:choice-of-anchor D domain-containing protein, partial [bacterium]|nr:choice-of-anchor D domain-containing protein [bacterium]